MDNIISQLISSPDCDIHLRSTPPTIPPLETLPSDIRDFFTRCTGGRLFYHPDYPTPQFGCILSLPQKPVSRSLGYDEEADYCEGEEFDSLYAIAEYDSLGDYSVAAVSTLPKHFGHIFILSYNLGDPTLQWSDVTYISPSFARWLSIHLAAWETYQTDWREGLQHFKTLIKAEQRALRPPA